MRAITLGLRLFINITAGHFLLTIVSIVVAQVSYSLMLVLLMILTIELLASILQSLVFLMLASSYINSDG